MRWLKLDIYVFSSLHIYTHTFINSLTHTLSSPYTNGKRIVRQREKIIYPNPPLPSPHPSSSFYSPSSPHHIISRKKKQETRIRTIIRIIIGIRRRTKTKNTTIERRRLITHHLSLIIYH